MPSHSSLGNKSETPSQKEKGPSNVTSVFHSISGVPVLYVTFPFWDSALGYFTFLHFAGEWRKPGRRSLQ
uniref:Uncharacterized protein n=1 Tax=Rhinopithecus roxellana TaxID=61622 RepID=A0A2K6NAM4_RHIRO